MEETILTDGDIADVLAGRDTFEEETVARLALCVRSDPRAGDQIERLQQQALDAGLDPQASPEAIILARSFFKDFEVLLARDDWSDPLEVLDPEERGIQPIGYEALIRIAEARAEREEDTARILVVKKKLERAQFRLERCLRHRDAFLESLAGLALVMAEDLFCETAFRFQRLQRTLADACGERMRAQNAEEQVEQQLDRLVEATSWSHPVQVLAKPRAEFAALLRACRLRLSAASGEHRKHLGEVQAKLERAVNIAETARRRRQKRGREMVEKIAGFAAEEGRGATAGEG